MAADQDARSALTRWPAILAALLAAAFAVRLIGLDGRWLWYDELLAANFAGGGLWSTLTTTLRFDIHPPLFNLQLSLWSMLGTGDVWMMLNSVLWSVIAAAILFFCARRLYDERTAFIALALFAFSPAALAYGDQVRMYAMLMAFIIWVWYAQVRWIDASEAENRFPPFAYTANLVLSQACLLYTHSAALVMVVAPLIWSAAALFLKRDWPLAIRWFLVQCVVLVAALPVVGIALLRDAAHPVVPSLGDMLQTWRFLAAGPLGPTLWGALMGAGLFAALAYVMLRVERARLPIAALIFAPLVLAALVSHLVKPIWLDRIFVTLIPFLCLFLALGIAAAPRIGRWALAAFALAAALVGISGQFVREKGDGYRPAAEHVRALAAPGETVLVDGDFNFWCFNWYFAGPDWGSPGQAYVMTPKWEGLTARLGETGRRLMGLGDANEVVEAHGARVTLWDRASEPAPPGAPQTFLLVHMTGAEPAAFAGYVRESAWEEKGIAVERWRAAAP